VASVIWGLLAASNTVRPINQFGVHEITTEVFRDNLSRTVDNLTRLVSSQVNSRNLLDFTFQTEFQLSQASEIKALRAELESLNKSKNRQKIQREQRKKTFNGFWNRYQMMMMLEQNEEAPS
jgi:hypothetical protein